MFRLCVLLIAAVAIAAANEGKPVVTDELLADLAAKGATWKYGHNKFSQYTQEDVSALLGTKMMYPGSLDLPLVSTVKALPTSFDSRTQWPGFIHPIRDQEQCGSCWAFAAAESLTDRFTIQSNGSVNVTLSPQDLVSCDRKNGNSGCDGGYPFYAWKYMQTTGIVADACYPYTSGQGVTGTCKLGHGTVTCPSGQGNATRFHAKSAYQVATNAEAIATEIMTNGPVEAAFTVYSDFMSYTSGVYKHVSGSVEGGHAVKIIGWGVEGGEDYWLVANSWNTNWGIEGYFKILKGVNECGIEAGIVAGLADV